MDDVDDPDFFRREDVVILFTTSLAGLGHVRVTEALRRGLPTDIRPELIGINDQKIQFFHRITTRNRVLRNVGDFIQNSPIAEGIFTYIYRRTLRRGTDDVVSQISDLIKRRRPKPNVLVIISTHFGLAHKIASIKEKLSKELKMCVILCVIVTDDSPQDIWGVYGADYIFVPSEYTKDELTSYLRNIQATLPSIIVSPYSVSPLFAEDLPLSEFENRCLQVKSSGGEMMQIIIPISGAAVQLSYFKTIIAYLDRKSKAKILVISRDSSYTKEFLRWCEEIPTVEVIAERADRDIVDNYERELIRRTISLEITKPSEQLFKALLSPKQRGGVLLLFSEPVGRQERDNLSFLERYGLIPDINDQKIIFNLYEKENRAKIDSDFLKRARKWRGLLLPKNGYKAGRVVFWLKKTGILVNMMHFEGFPKSEELSGESVKIFWNKLEGLVKDQCSDLQKGK